MQTNIYTLPELDFVGGRSNEFTFRIVQGGRPLDLSDAQADFALCDYAAKSGSLLFHCNTENDPDRIIIDVDGEGVFSLIRVLLPPDATLELFGKYVYQLTVAGAGGLTEVKQGLMNITRNIHQDYITSLTNG